VYCGRSPSASQDRDLVAQNHDLELALTAPAGEQTNETAEEPVQQTGQQDAQSEPLRPSPPAPPVPAEPSFFTPQAQNFGVKRVLAANQSVHDGPSNTQAVA